ncbi:sugar transporter [Chryseobacterium sp. Leaf180]|nr:sugar transporter [Chryseobacterium sp. Leaf180]
MNIRNFVAASAVAVTLASCTARQELNYMKDIENVALENSVKNSRSTLQPGDQLIITVSAKDLDVVKPFNQNYSSTATVAQYTQASGNNQFQPVPASGPTYQVDTDGNIDFPQLGSVNTKGENVESFKRKLVDGISKYVKEPVVEVRLINFKIAIMGEVNKPGTYVIPDGTVTLPQALALAGDLTTFGVRNNILLVRTVDGKITQERIDFSSAKFFNSPSYYLKQNDLIYVQPNSVRERAARIDPNTGLYISVASVIASIALGVLALTRN